MWVRVMKKKRGHVGHLGHGRSAQADHLQHLDTFGILGNFWQYVRITSDNLLEYLDICITLGS